MSSSADMRELGNDFRLAFRGARRVVWIAAGAAVVIWLLSGTSCIEADQVGFVRRFGKVVRKDIQPGLTLLLPWPIDQLDTVPWKKDRRLESGFSVKTAENHVKIDSTVEQEIPYCLTADQNIIHISMVAWYQIKDPYRYLYEAVDPDAVLAHVVNDAIIGCAAGMTIDGILTTEKELLRARAQKTAQSILDDLGTGLLIKDLQLETPPTVPRETEAAFQSVIDAKVGMQTAKYHAQEFAKTIKGEAAGYAAQIVGDAHAARLARERQAESDAGRFLAVMREYRKDKAITRLRMYLQTMDVVMGKVKRYVLPAGRGRVGPSRPVPPALRTPQ